MITPSFSLTATERVLPKLALDFTTASLDPRVTFTRTTGASNPATYVGSNGYVTAATDNQPRFDYSPTTLACKGLLIEESRINLLTYSEQFDNGDWVKVGTTISADAVTSPDGTLNADKLVEDTSNGAHHAKEDKSTAASTAYTYTIYVKAAGRSNLALTLGGNFAATSVYYNLTTQAMTVRLGSPTAYSITDAGNGWYRCSITKTSNASVGTANIYVALADSTPNVSYQGDGTSGLYVWGAQLEAGAFATSYIPTTSASLTRNADVATMTGTNFSDWYNATQGTFEAKFDFIGPAALSSALDQRIFTVHQAAAIGSNNLQCYRTAADGKINVAAINGGSAQVNGAISSTITVANTTYNATFGYKLNLFAASLNADTVFTDNVGTVPVSIDRLIFGSYNDTTGKLNGHMKNFNYWPQRLINNEVQSFSKI